MKTPKRSDRKPWPDDPVVAEVRRWRALMMKKAGGTVEGLMSYLDERAASARRPGPKPTRRARKGRAA
jgi:hypothetical protein